MLSTAPVVADLRGAHLHHGVAGAGAHRAGGRRARAAAARGVAALVVVHGGDLDEDHAGAAPHQRAGHGQLGAEGEEEDGGEEEEEVAGHGGGGGECQVSAGRVTAGMVGGDTTGGHTLVTGMHHTHTHGTHCRPAVKLAPPRPPGMTHTVHGHWSCVMGHGSCRAGMSGI